MFYVSFAQSEISQLLVEKKELVNQAIELRDHVMREVLSNVLLATSALM